MHRRSFGILTRVYIKYGGRNSILRSSAKLRYCTRAFFMICRKKKLYGSRGNHQNKDDR